MTQPTRKPFAPKRRSISPKKRAQIFLDHGGICWLCKLKIGADEPYEIDHQVARELMGEGADEDSNLAPAHKDCHKEKTKRDVAMISKSNRIRRNLDPETRKKSKKPIVSRGFDKTRKKKFSGEVVSP